MAALRSRHIDTPWPGGQSYRQVVAEMAGFLREVMDEWQGGLVLAVSHSANRWALQNLLDGTPLEELVLTRRLSGGRGGSTASAEVGRVGCPSLPGWVSSPMVWGSH
ncbi:histidine phosphatase family protein [Nonomuraea angiospora]